MEPMYNLVIAVAGPLGSGCSTLVDELVSVANDWPGCQALKVKVAEGITIWADRLLGLKLDPAMSTHQRRASLQDAGNRLRKRDGELVAKLISTQITLEALDIEKKASEKSAKSPSTLVFVVDSLKNAGDVAGLRRIFRDEFMLVVVAADRETRWHRVKDYRSWTADDRPDFERLDAVDRNQKGAGSRVGDIGQETEALARHADYYVVNDRNRQDLQQSASRIIDLFIGGPRRSQPTADERRMHLAFSASNGSGCLSRQVGAALFNSNGDIIGLGHNDVPKARGGLYSVEDGDNDNRCYLVGDARCMNDTIKDQRFKNLAQDVYGAIKEACTDTIEKTFKRDPLDAIQKTIKGSELRDATEYCRAVHAEMSALLTAARSRAGATIDSTMYITTYPCHNCAKHILCAGVKRVVYVEPYPKSLAANLHSDGLSIDLPTQTATEKTLLVPYQGIAPWRFHDIFAQAQDVDRKDKEGRAIRKSKDERASGPRLAARVWQRLRSANVSVGWDQISYTEMKVSDEVWQIWQDAGGVKAKRTKTTRHQVKDGSAGRRVGNRGSERHP
jgi:deoxycytidylate deaminase